MLRAPAKAPQMRSPNASRLDSSCVRGTGAFILGFSFSTPSITLVFSPHRSVDHGDSEGMERRRIAPSYLCLRGAYRVDEWFRLGQALDNGAVRHPAALAHR